jgi:hypothetical protein
MPQKMVHTIEYKVLIVRLIIAIYHRERSDTPTLRSGSGGGTNPRSLPVAANDGTKNIRTILEGFGVDN